MVTQGVLATADHVAGAILQEIFPHTVVCETLRSIDRFLAPADDELLSAVIKDLEQEGSTPLVGVMKHLLVGLLEVRLPLYSFLCRIRGLTVSDITKSGEQGAICLAILKAPL